MLHKTRNLRVLSRNCVRLRQIQRNVSSKEVRKRFNQFFIDKYDHKFVRSSPVVPLCDPTVAFVNAGMNQFKGIFLGKKQPEHRRVVNSQKCIRVGGKHNDLNIVGTDGYHHTFFEMLGNWSFGDYFKRDACTMAWELITKEYRIDPNRLYVTYFGGDKTLQLEADKECFNIWREIGISKDRIIPFGSKENFWEMGPTGPCGPCSEIHIDHIPGTQRSRAEFVNKDLPDLTELWNIVFIQFNRNQDGSISNLPNKHIDTGMGLERLCAILQDKSSNYDTDLFSPIFDTISKHSKIPQYSGIFDITNPNCDLDTAYRVIADHARMVTACLADGMVPDQNHKLRRILRKVLLLSDRVFKTADLPYQIIPVICDILGEAYPEMHLRQKEILKIVKNEEEIVKSLRQSSGREVSEILSQLSHKNVDEMDFLDNPGFLPALKDLKNNVANFPRDKNSGKVFYPDEYIKKLYGTYGLDEESMERLGSIEDVLLDKESFKRCKKEISKQGKSSYLENTNDDISDQSFLKKMSSLGLPSTSDSFKYAYKYDSKSNCYAVKPITSKLLGIVVNSNFKDSLKVQSIDSEMEVFLIFDKTNFYCEAGGQDQDYGLIALSSGVELPITQVLNCQDKILHKIGNTQSLKGILKVGEEMQLFVDEINRTGNTIHHTSTHLLNSSVHKVLEEIVYQKSSSVTSQGLRLELGVIGSNKIDLENVIKIEKRVNELIEKGCPVRTDTIDYDELVKRGDILTIPGEIYPEENLRLLSISGKELESKELCCGTHVENVREIGKFCITNVKLLSRGTYQINAIAGEAAKRAEVMGLQMQADVQTIKQDLNSGKQKIENLEARVQRLKNMLLQGFNKEFTIPHVIKVESLEILNAISREIRDVTRDSLKEFIEIEMKAVLDERPLENYKFIVHNLTSSALMETVRLQKATRLCTDRPALVMCLSGGQIKARACVPTELAGDDFNAEKWLQTVADVFDAKIAPPKGQNPLHVCNMKAKKVSVSIVEDQIETAQYKAKEYAQKYLS